MFYNVLHANWVRSKPSFTLQATALPSSINRFILCSCAYSAHVKGQFGYCVVSTDYFCSAIATFLEFTGTRLTFRTNSSFLPRILYVLKAFCSRIALAWVMKRDCIRAIPPKVR